MRTLEMSQATDTLANYARNIRRHPVVITTHGKPVATLVSLHDTDMETAALSTNPRFYKLIEHSRARYKSEGGISGKEMYKRLGLRK